MGGETSAQNSNVSFLHLDRLLEPLRFKKKKKIVTLPCLFCVSPEFSTILHQGAKLANGSFQANLQYFSKNNKPSH